MEAEIRVFGCVLAGALAWMGMKIGVLNWAMSGLTGAPGVLDMSAKGRGK
jgi:hypothetical protein